MRVHFDVSDPGISLEDLRTGFGPVGQAYGITWQLHDLLFRKSTGALNIEIPAIVANHRDFEPLAQSYGIPFHHIPVTKDTKAEAEARLLEMVRELDVDLVVLARYMQILSDDLCIRGPARGPLASGPGMAGPPCRTDDLGGGATGPERRRWRR